MVPEDLLEETEAGRVPRGDGWFVLNARDARWRPGEGRGAYCIFEGAADFPQLGFHLVSLRPGDRMSMYHWEADQEDFLVLSGKAVLIIEGEERPLAQWDFVHCPPNANHVFVGGTDGPCAILMIGARHEQEAIVYPVEPAAQKFGAGVDVETPDPRVAYAGTPPSTDTACPWPA